MECFLLWCVSMPELQLPRTHFGWIVLTSLFLGGTVVGSVTSALIHQQFSAAAQSVQRGPLIPLPEAGAATPPSLAHVAHAAAQSVVYISTRLKPPPELTAEADALKGKEHLQEMLRNLFKEHPGRQKETNMGSGFVVGAQGEILTNLHVINNAEEITVRLPTQDEYTARIIGVDPMSDLALLKITPSYALPVLPLADSESVRVGDWVMAIGSPFGLEQTVTTGIVSAKGRALGTSPYDDFIQTDASINPGNSGGPLLNLRGEVIGISSAILGTSGVNAGIGFATPAEVAKTVIAQLREHGKVTRGWMGVTIQSTPLPDSPWLSFSQRSGALVTELTKDGPADQAGLRIGDIILLYNGRHITKSHELPLLISRTPVGSDAEVALIRQLRMQTLRVRIGVLAN